MKKIIIIMTSFSILAYGIGLLLTQDKISWTLGVFLGLVIAILKLKLMKNTLTKAMAMPEDKAKSYTQRHYMIRYILTGVLLLVAALTPGVSLLGVFIGLLSMKVGAYAELYTTK
ncbi:MAG: ATP synthase subunit I [Cellulosilyticaceae bacterium]